MSQHVTLVSAGETSSDTPNDYQNIRNDAWGNSRANGGVWGDVDALFCRPPTPISFGNSRKSALPRTPGNQGTPSRSLALECKCAFGAIKFKKYFSQTLFINISSKNWREPIAVILDALESRHSQLLNAPKIIKIYL